MLLIGLALTALATWGTHSLVSDQEHQLLKKRVAELNVVLATSIDTIESSLASQGGVIRSAGESLSASTAAAQEASQRANKTSRFPVTFAWLRRTAPGRWSVLSAGGPSLHPGDVVTGVQAQALERSLTTTKLVPTSVFGPDRTLGWALGPPAAPAGTAVYRQSDLGPLRAPPAASSQPFAELELAIYASAHPDASRALAASPVDLPLTGDVANAPLQAGVETWLTSVRAKEPLVGSIAANTWWMVLLLGLLLSLLVAAVIETIARRRDLALHMYAFEHRVAETLQRSLLPVLPEIPGVELAARYIAGGEGLEVGGDWYDAFEIAGGRVGIAVGDVIGHDVVAAGAMGQIRAVLRAFALGGEQPAAVLDRLDYVVNALGLTQLVTVVYAVLDPPATDGTRRLTYANAGHLAPMVREPDGGVCPLAGGESLIIGAPGEAEDERGQTEHALTPGSTLVLFTDGLVEVPGRSLDDTMNELADQIRSVTGEEPLERLCDRLLATTRERALRDDIALLAVRIGVGETNMQPQVDAGPRSRRRAV